MKISLNWLKRHIENFNVPVQEISSKLTDLGFEVEGVEDFGKIYSGLLIVEVLECAAHPDSDHLSVTKVFDGKEHLQVVCGAPNVKAGIKAVLASIGVELPLPDGKSLKMKKSKIRGVESFGMLCAEDEIGLGTNHEGILILPENAETGKSFVELGYYDTVFELNVTPNRPDGLSHLGIARELAAAFGFPLASCRGKACLAPTPVPIQLNIESPSACPHYVGRVIKNVKIAPSPLWMQKLLSAVGINPINNVVDVTNFVLMDLGQPLHSFDLGKLKAGEIKVRFARKGEKLTTLDHKEHELQDSDLLICDGDAPACIAGVMGGVESEITEGTTDVFLESAFFNPTVVRKQAKRLGFSSDSSYRFERGVDFELQNFACDYACSLITELASGEISEQAEFISKENLPKRNAVPLREERIEKLLGLKVPIEQANKLLAGINITQTAENSGMYNIPSWRFDLEREADLIEEVARLVGYEKIPYELPSFKAEINELPIQEKINRKIRNSLSALGLHECLSLRFTNKKKIEWLFGTGDDKRAKPAELLNPLSEELAVIPTSLLPNLISSAAENAKHQKSVRLFEVSKAQFPTPETANEKDPGFKEVPMLAIVFAEPKADFFEFKGLLEALFKNLRLDVKTDCNPSQEESYLHPGCSAVLKLRKKVIGSCGELHPVVQNKFDLKLKTFVCEIDLSALEAEFLAPVSFKEFSKQMIIERDVSIEVEESATHAELVSKFKSFNPKFLSGIELISIYQGDKIATGKKNLLYRFFYQSPDRTLTDEEINTTHAKLREKIAQAGLVLR